MAGLLIVRGGRKLPDICNKNSLSIDSSINIISIRGKNYHIPVTLISKDNLNNSNIIKSNKKIKIRRIRSECSICNSKRYLKLFKCSHVLCMICMDNLRNVYCPLCRECIEDQLCEIHIEMISFRKKEDLKESQKQIAEDDEKYARELNG